MERKMLVAVDDSLDTKKCLTYVAGLFSHRPGWHCSLFHVQPMVSRYLEEEIAKDPWAGKELSRIIKNNAQAAEKLAATAKATMIGLGFSDQRISVSTPQRVLGVAKDILEYALKNTADAIVVGRRGLTRWQQAVMGSVSAKLIEHSQVTPVWVVDGNPDGRRFLMAVDGSENALRLVDHVGFMLAGDPTVRLILFHVPCSADDLLESGADVDRRQMARYVRAGDRCMIQEWMGRAQAALREAGFGPEQIDIRIARGQGKTARRILEAASRMNCATVVTGRRGINRAFFFGSVSHAVAHGIRNRALWLVP